MHRNPGGAACRPPFRGLDRLRERIAGAAPGDPAPTVLSVARSDDGGALTIDCEMPPNIDEATAARLRHALLAAADPLSLGAQAEARIQLNVFVPTRGHSRTSPREAPPRLPRLA